MFRKTFELFLNIYFFLYHCNKISQFTFYLKDIGDPEMGSRVGLRS